LKDATWLRPLRDGEREAAVSGTGAPEMTNDDWDRPARAAIGLLLSGDGLASNDPYGSVVTDDTFLLLLNAEAAPVRFRIPAVRQRPEWRIVLDTEDDGPVTAAPEKFVSSGRVVEMAARSVLLLAVPARA
jgi:glycogen operon protein